MTAEGKKESSKRLVLTFIQVVFIPILCIAPIAGILIWVVGLNASEQLTRGILYGCLFLACVAVGYRKFSLAGIGITTKNIGRGFGYAGIVLVAGFAFMLLLQPPEGLVDISLAVWSPILFYLAVALAEEVWFRGLIFRALYDWKGALPAVFGSAILFGLMHVPMQGWEGLRFSLSMGLPYAIIRLKTDNILGLVVIHWLINLTDSFIRLSDVSLSMGWVALLYIAVFSGVSVVIVLVDRRLRR